MFIEREQFADGCGVTLAVKEEDCGGTGATEGLVVGEGGGRGGFFEFGGGLGGR